MKRKLSALLLSLCFSALPFVVLADDEGELDPTFGNGHGYVEQAPDAGQGAWISSYDGAVAMLRQSDGKFVSAGYLSVTMSTGISRHNADGSLDTTFNGTGKLKLTLQLSFQASSIVQQPDGKLVVAGSCSNEMSKNSFCLVRLTTSGAIDKSFGSAGVVVTKNAGANESSILNTLTLQADGKLVAAGALSDGSNPIVMLMMRYNTDGSQDTDFDGDGKLVTTISEIGRSVIQQTDGKLVVAGHTPDVDAVFVVSRFTANGALDTTFHGTGSFVTDVHGQYVSVIQHSNGKLLLAGPGSAVANTGTEIALLRLTEAGELDDTFSGDGKQFTSITPHQSFDPGNGELHYTGDYVYSLLEDENSNIVVAGETLSPTTEPQAIVARYTQDGVLDSAFGNAGIVLTDGDKHATGFHHAGVVRQPDGKLVAAGTVDRSTADFQLTRYNADGTLDKSFGKKGSAVTDFSYFAASEGANAVVQQHDGKLVAAGWTTINGNQVFGLVRYLPDGKIDKTFGDAGRVNAPEVQSIAATAVIQQQDEKLVAAGDGFLVRYNLDGSRDAAWGMGQIIGNLYLGNIHAVLQRADGRLAVAVDAYDTVAFKNRLAVTNISNEGILDKVDSASVGDDGVAEALVEQSDGKLVAAGSGANAATGWTREFALVRFNTDGALDPSFNGDGAQQVQSDAAWKAGNVSKVLEQPDHKIVVAAYSVDEAGRNLLTLIRLNADGSLDSGFGSAGMVVLDGGYRWAKISGLVRQGDDKLLVSGTLTDGISKTVAMVRFNPDGTLDITFGTGGIQTFDVGSQASTQDAQAMIMQVDGKPVVVGVNSRVSAKFKKSKAFVARMVLNKDQDFDGISNDQDNCSKMPNFNQVDMDGDGIGNVCDRDRDGDGFNNGKDRFPDDALQH